MQTGGFPRPSTGVRLVWFRRFSFEALVSSVAAQAPGVTAEHHPLMGSSLTLRSFAGSRVAPSWIVGCFRESLSVRGIPQTAGPPNRETRVHSALDRIPSRVLRHLPRNTRSVSDRRRPSVEFRRPSTASLISPRSVKRAVHAHLGAAPGFSQPPSGFSFDQVPRPCFMPQPFLDCLPSERSPRRGRVPVPRPLMLPCSYPPCPETRSSDLIAPDFTDSHV